MTSGAYMGIVGVYLMLFGMLKESEPLNWIGLILATIGFIIAARAEDNLKYQIGGERMTKKEKWLYDMTPVCKNCGKEAPVNEEMSTDEWKVYITKNPCKCGCENWINRSDYEEAKK